MIPRMKHAMRGRRATLLWMFAPRLWLDLPLTVLFGVAVIWLARSRSLSISFMVYGGVLLLTAQVVAGVLMIRRGIRARDELRAADGLLCIGCGYALSPEQPDGVCPECGRAYQADAVRKGWGTTVARETERFKRRRKPSRDREALK